MDLVLTTGGAAVLLIIAHCGIALFKLVTVIIKQMGLSLQMIFPIALSPLDAHV